MKTIDKEFTYKNFNYKQILRDGKIAIYEQKLKDGIKINYEVVIIEEHNGYEIAGNKFPPAEMYPSSNQWGVKGFTFTDYDDAFVKFKKLKKKNEK
jgi:hypothetical protein